MGKLSPHGRIYVQTVCLDDIVASGNLPSPDILKIDVEGAEVQVLQGAVSLLSKAHPIIFLSTHGLELNIKCCDLLVSFGYNLRPISGNCVAQTDDVLAVYN